MEQYKIEKVDKNNALLIIYNKKYQISSIGTVSNPRGYILKGNNNGKGYLSIHLSGSTNNKQRLYIHRIVAQAFIPNPDNLPQVNHKDGNKSNNHVDNLEWTTQLENNRHAWNTGLCKDVTKNRKKRVKQIDKNGEVIKVWESCADAARYYSCTKELINQAARKTCTRCKSAKGYIWEYEEEMVIENKDEEDRLFMESSIKRSNREKPTSGTQVREKQYSYCV